jgi:hypothetical protein
MLLLIISQLTQNTAFSKGTVFKSRTRAEAAPIPTTFAS